MALKFRLTCCTLELVRENTVAKTPSGSHAAQQGEQDAPPTGVVVRAAPPEGIGWVYHSTQFDSNNKFWPMSSAVVRDNCPEMLATPIAKPLQCGRP